MYPFTFALFIVLVLSPASVPASTQNQHIQGKQPGKTVILVHGYYEDSRDMQTLAHFLEKQGYRPVTVDLPLTFKHIPKAAKVFAKRVEAILSGLPDKEPVAMVGHSAGGLVIRYFLSHNPNNKRVTHAVLVATPNRGVALAGMLGEISNSLVETLATLDSLQPENISNLQLSDPPGTRMGAIAGNKSTIILGQLLEKENDGRVEVESVYYPGLDDFVVLPHSHKEIHRRKETAELVERFLNSASFALQTDPGT